ncbi:MAG TPA: class I SAM-dependent methyltransferase, partial [Xanthobacteraceae bacterium]
MRAAWAAFDVDQTDPEAKDLLVKLLHFYPGKLQVDRRLAYLALLRDRQVEPDTISNAGWMLVLRSHGLGENSGEAEPAALIAAWEDDELALTLLQEAPVGLAAAERLLTLMRRVLLLSDRWRDHPKLVRALEVQASLNGAAWPFDDTERRLLARQESGAMLAAYLPAREHAKESSEGDRDDPVTGAVQAQYESWPYPAWTRITVVPTRQLPDVIESMDPELAKGLPVKANMLIAGCGTGRQAASVALRYPDAEITALDISEASLTYARRQCAALGIGNVRFLKLDLYDVADLKQRFHAIHSAGVLHHLSDPE